jgi:hypothetical protein
MYIDVVSYEGFGSEEREFHTNNKTRKTRQVMQCFGFKTNQSCSASVKCRIVFDRSMGSIRSDGL